MTLALAFLGGLVSCLSPCVLPVIPVFLAQLVRPSVNGAAHGGAIAWAPARYRAAGFLLGFIGVFVAIWVSLGLVGYALVQAVPNLRFGMGMAIIALGFAVIVGWRPNVAFGRLGHTGSAGGAFLLGSGVAVGWTPCIGPTLGAILTLAAASGTVLSGAALLVAYGLGMSVPFVLVGLGALRAGRVRAALTRHARLVEAGSGALIVAAGFLVATDSFARLAALVPWTF